MKRKCILLRHGKTEGNKLGKYIGCRTDEPLCENGIEEIGLHKNEIREVIGKSYKINSSPMLRAKETAQLLFDTDDINYIDTLVEMDFGDFENKCYQELNGDPTYQAWIDSGGKNDFPGAESRQAFINRSIEGFITALKSSDEKTTSVIVCHGGNIMAIMSSLCGGDFYDYMVHNLEGYEISYTLEDETLFDITYNRISVKRGS